jgi:predicted kinase
MNRPFVVVSGLPGSGKSTLARQLAEALCLPLLDKDHILDRLFESRGIGDSEWRRRLSRESDIVLEGQAAASGGAVLTSLWRVQGMPADSGTSTNWFSRLSNQVVNVHCLCPPELAAKRFIERTRHAGHLDANATYADILASLQALAGLGPPEIGPRVDIDTTIEIEVDNLVREVRSAFTRCPVSAISPCA